MSEENINEEEENQAIEQIAKKILDSEMDEIIPIILTASLPFVYVFGELSRVVIGPYTVLLGKHEKSFDKYISMFEKRKNIRRLMNRIDELSEAKRENEKRRKKEAKKNGAEAEGKTYKLLQRLRKFKI